MHDHDALKTQRCLLQEAALQTSPSSLAAPSCLPAQTPSGVAHNNFAPIQRLLFPFDSCAATTPHALKVLQIKRGGKRVKDVGRQDGFNVKHLSRLASSRRSDELRGAKCLALLADSNVAQLTNLRMRNRFDTCTAVCVRRITEEGEILSSNSTHGLWQPQRAGMHVDAGSE